MSLLAPANSRNEIILNTPNRNEILKAGPPRIAKCDILGRGTYGTVFKAIFKAKPVAVKVIRNLNDINIQTMQNEANILGWRHRNIVKIILIESTPNFGIVIMERFMSGHCLQMVLETVPLPLIHKVCISIDILSALRYCHKNDLLHLDVKPQNVLVSVGKFVPLRCKQKFAQYPKRRCYKCKLCDFGLSMLMRNQQNSTINGYAKGTVRYMSPEALCEALLTPSADIYSLGVTMWQLNARRIPYDWIECNDVVAYQVVKNNLRPDYAVADAQEKTLLQRDCSRCDLSLDNLQHKLEQQHAVWKQLGNSIKKNPLRQPFKELNAAARNFCSEPSQKDDTMEQLRAFECAELHPFADVFETTGLKQDKRSEAIYGEICKRCWTAEVRLRINSFHLKKQLQQLLESIIL